MKKSNLLVSEELVEELKKESVKYPSLDLTHRQQCDLELLLNGGFSPLKGYLNQEDYECILDKVRLKDGNVWPIPICLDVSEDLTRSLKSTEKIALRNEEGVLLAILNVGDIWKIDKEREATEIFGTNHEEHPGVYNLYHNVESHYLGGELEGVQLPIHYDFKMLRLTPSELRERFRKLGWKNVVGFQTRNPIHRAHIEMTLQAAKDYNANLLIHPAVGATKPGDINHYVRVRCYMEAIKKYPPDMAMLSILPLAMRMAGPREALWHALIRKNYGCTHFIVGRDHAGVSLDSSEKPFYGSYAAQDFLKRFEKKIGIKIVPFKEMVYVQQIDKFLPIDDVPDRLTHLTISGSELRRRLIEGVNIPDWFSYPDVISELKKAFPPRNRQGFTVFFTGLSSSGKSTLANVLLVKLLEMNERPVTLLDGDIVRKNLSSELGFSKEHRDLNVMRIGFVAKEITKNRGIAICAPIAPYEKIRGYNRNLISAHGGYIEIYVSTPLEVCEKRDRKGLYVKARKGIIKGFTGIDDPYEVPKNPEITLDTSKMSPEEAVHEILLYLENNGYIK
jgi:sulfate adenylyltransferase